MRTPLLTVSVAAYNVEEYIEECLRPFTEEGIVDRCEVLIIDDGATDNTAKIALGFESVFPNTFKVINKKNGGWGSTVNCGIDLANGCYFKHLDGDDYFDTDGLKAFLDFLETADADIVLSEYSTFISDTKKEIQNDDPAERFSVEYFKEYKLTDLNQDKTVDMHHCTFKTSILQENKIRLLEKAFYTDVELVVKVLCCACTVIVTPFKVYCYRIQRAGQSMSVEGIRKHYNEHKSVLFRSAEYIRNKTDSIGYGLAINRMKHMACFQYYFFMCLEPSLQHYTEIKKYDRELKMEYPELYKHKDRIIILLRKSFFLAYFPLCIRYNKRIKNDPTV